MSWGSHHVFPISVKQTRPKTDKSDRLTQYVTQLRAVFRAHSHWFRTHLRAVVADGQYVKKMFMDAVSDEGVAFVTKLGSNANLLIPFTGTHENRRGARKRWERKVDFVDFAGWVTVPGAADERVWTRVVWGPHFERHFRVVVIQRLNSNGAVMAHVVLCSTVNANLDLTHLRQLELDPPQLNSWCDNLLLRGSGKQPCTLLFP